MREDTETGEFELLDDVDGCCAEEVHSETERVPELWARRTLHGSEVSTGIGRYRSADCAACGHRLHYCGPRITLWAPADADGHVWTLPSGAVGFVDRKEAWSWARKQYGANARLRWWTEAKNARGHWTEALNTGSAA